VKRRHPVATLALALGCALALVLGCIGETAAQLLNSDRIEQVFGSYGVDVLVRAPEALRISSLYSTEGGIRTTRTLAIVAWPSAVDPGLADAHAAILAGASIGATLESAGWTVTKRNLYFGETPAPDSLSRLMRIPATPALATHGYVLSVTRGDLAVDYATIAELHHPAYLDLAMLEAIYGPVEPADAGQGAAVRQLVRNGLNRLVSLGSQGSE